MKNKFCALALLILSFIFFGCNESSSISIMQALASSQPKDGKRWKSAEIIYNTSNPNKVDAAIILANDGMYVVTADIEASGEDYLSKPTFKNNMKDNNGGLLIDGLIRNVYVPSNYDSTSAANIIIQCVSSKLYEKPKYYKVNLNDLSTVSPLTIQEDLGEFCTRSSVPSSHFIMLKSTTPQDGKLVYKIGKYVLSGDTIGFTSSLDISSDFKISNFFENGPDLSYFIFTSTTGDDVKEQEYYKYSRQSQQFVELNKLYSLAIRNFVIDSDGEFIAFTQSGNVIHSQSKKNYLYTSDSYFSYNRYTPLACFVNTNKEKEDEPDYTFFGKYSSNGFIIQGYNKTLVDNKIYNSVYKGSVQTQGYAENLRAEDISELKAVRLSSSQEEYDFRILVLSSENGVSTFLFKSLLPDQMKYNTQSKESRNRVDLFV